VPAEGKGRLFSFNFKVEPLAVGLCIIIESHIEEIQMRMHFLFLSVLLH
jgi:hypothetical protein